MPDLSLSRDNLFQLNLLIWATLPQAPGAPITPVLRDNGYHLYSIEQPLPSSTGDVDRFSETPAHISPNPVVDVLLHHKVDDRMALIECKPASFGISSGLSPQARGFIAAGGNLAPRLGLAERQDSECCYLVPNAESEAMDHTLVDIVGELDASGIPTCPVGSVGVLIDNEGVYLSPSISPDGSAPLPFSITPQARVIRTAPGEDPQPLYVIPWIPDADPQSLGALREKMRVHLLRWLGLAEIGEHTILRFEDLLDQITGNVFSYWRDRNSLVGRVFPMIQGLSGAFFRDDARIVIRRRELVASLESESDRIDVMERVRSASLPQRLPEGVQLQMDEQA